jgi:hypothetical protein
MNQKVFIASTIAAANLAADEWWNSQKGLRQVSRTKVAVGNDGPELAKADQCSVTIHFEPENSN